MDVHSCHVRQQWRGVHTNGIHLYFMKESHAKATLCLSWVLNNLMNHKTQIQGTFNDIGNTLITLVKHNNMTVHLFVDGIFLALSSHSRYVGSRKIGEIWGFVSLTLTRGNKNCSMWSDLTEKLYVFAGSDQGAKTLLIKLEANPEVPQIVLIT